MLPIQQITPGPGMHPITTDKNTNAKSQAGERADCMVDVSGPQPLNINTRMTPEQLKAWREWNLLTLKERWSRAHGDRIMTGDETKALLVDGVEPGDNRPQSAPGEGVAHDAPANAYSHSQSRFLHPFRYSRGASCPCHRSPQRIRGRGLLPFTSGPE